jgi:hypothetical protein
MALFSRRHDVPRRDPSTETKIARVPTGSPAPRAELGRACCPILIARGGPRPWGLIRDRQQSAMLMLRSSNSVDEGAPSVARWQWGTAPDPWSGAGIQLGRGNPRGEGDLAGVGEALPGQGLAAEQPPPALLQVQPARLLGMNTCRSRGWPASQSRVATLVWLDRLSVTTTTSPVGLACSTSERKR